MSDAVSILLKILIPILPIAVSIFIYVSLGHRDMRAHPWAMAGRIVLLLFIFSWIALMLYYLDQMAEPYEPKVDRSKILGIKPGR